MIGNYIIIVDIVMAILLSLSRLLLLLLTMILSTI